MKYFTSDTHFDHKRIIELSGRPFKNKEEMADRIISQWNDIMSKKDDLYILGDFCFSGNFDYYLQQIIPKVHLIIGNHEHQSIKNSRYLESCSYQKIIKDNGRKYFLSHCPHRTWPSSQYGCIHIHGHTHGSIKSFNMSIDVGCDTMPDFMPYSINDINDFADYKKIDMIEQVRAKFLTDKNKWYFCQDDVKFLINKLGI